MPDLRLWFSLTLFGGAAAIAPPTPSALREFASWFARPATLPFAWQAYETANQRGDALEAFARGQQIMRLVPSWTDGQSGFAFRYALTADSAAAADPVAAEQRLRVALAWIEAGREHAGKRELDLLNMAAFLPDVACRVTPGLAERLRPNGGPEAISAAYLAEAERLHPSPAVREQRTFFAPRLAGALLATGDVSQALTVLDAAIARAAEVRDLELATEWAARLAAAARWLRGDRTVDLTAALADRRLEPLWPYLR
ncbi:MAG: hypothetical protein R3F29_06650 [Planctomycetota bacterium]